MRVGATDLLRMMVRRMLEEPCDDQGVTGSTLHQRLGQLQGKLTLPVDYFDAMFDLKLFGNDAAHIELKHFDNIGKEEVEDSIEITKELLRGIYQTQHLMQRMQKYKKTP